MLSGLDDAARSRPMSRSRSTWQRPVDRWLFLLLLLASVVPFWTVAYVPTQDGPSHLYNAVALRQYVFNPDGIERLYYELNPSPSANWVSHIALALPLSAISVSMPSAAAASPYAYAASPGGPTRLNVVVARQYAPPGVSQERPVQVDFGQHWRCSAARAQLEQACAAVRTEQKQRLTTMLGDG